MVFLSFLILILLSASVCADTLAIDSIQAGLFSSPRSASIQYVKHLDEMHGIWSELHYLDFEDLKVEEVRRDEYIRIGLDVGYKNYISENDWVIYYLGLGYRYRRRFRIYRDEIDENIEASVSCGALVGTNIKIAENYYLQPAVQPKMEFTFHKRDREGYDIDFSAILRLSLAKRW